MLGTIVLAFVGFVLVSSVITAHDDSSSLRTAVGELRTEGATNAALREQIDGLKATQRRRHVETERALRALTHQLKSLGVVPASTVTVIHRHTMTTKTVKPRPDRRKPKPSPTPTMCVLIPGTPKCVPLPTGIFR